MTMPTWPQARHWEHGDRQLGCTQSATVAWPTAQGVEAGSHALRVLPSLPPAAPDWQHITAAVCDSRLAAGHPVTTLLVQRVGLYVLLGTHTRSAPQPVVLAAVITG